MNVMLASPGDVDEDRNAVVREIAELNSPLAGVEDAVLVPIRWEIDAERRIDPQTRTQSNINTSLVAKCHVMVALFHTHFGSPSGEFLSHTEEEIDFALRVGLRVHLFFSLATTRPDTIDPTQLRLVKNYRQRMIRRDQGLVGDYTDTNDLRHQVGRILRADVATFRSGVRDAPALTGDLRVSLDTARKHLVLLNVGSNPLRDVEVTRVTAGSREIQFSGYGTKAELRSGGSRTIELRDGGLATTRPGTIEVECHWMVRGVRREDVFVL
ncbi:MAG: DUF4062 domain-containing protein [Bifidobacteriaceae bacterium]|nr:DUF4062 domain-containing protein [Bifidobacteriaceae bacterium]